MAATENASLISYRSTSSSFQPVFFHSWRTVSTGAIITHFGFEPAGWPAPRCAPSASIRAPSPCAADITTSAAAPSLTPGALPAVTVPSFLNAGFRARSVSMVVSSRGDSSLLNKPGGAPFFFAGISTGTICSLKRHSFMALTALRCEFSGVFVLLFARDPVLLGNILAGVAHVIVVVNVPQAVMNHRVDDLLIAQTESFARVRQKIRSIGHALHAAGDDHVLNCRSGSPAAPARPLSIPSRRPC